MRKVLAHCDQIAQNVRVVVVIHALHNGSDALKTHSSIDVLLGQRHERAIFLCIILCEDAIPILEEAIAIATRSAIRAPATYFRTLVEVQLGARTTRTGRASSPEIIVFTELRDVARIDAEVLPDLDRLIVIFEHGEIKPLERKTEHLSRKFKRPSAHFLLEVFAKGEIAEHLEEAQVAPRGADDIDIVGAHALLHGGGADIGRLQLLLLQEVGLELHHAGARQKKRRVVGNERGGGHELAAFLLEVVQVLLANLSGGHVTHRCSIRPLRSTKTVAADYSAPCALLFGRRRVIMGMARRHLPMGLRAQLRQLAAEQRRVVQLDGLHGAGGDAR